MLNVLNLISRLIKVSGIQCPNQESEQLICSQFKHDALLQLEQIFVHTRPYCLQVSFFCVKYIRRPHFTIFSRSDGVFSQVISMDIFYLFVIFHLHLKHPRFYSHITISISSWALCFKFYCDLVQKFRHNILERVTHSSFFLLFNTQENEQIFFTKLQECIETVTG